MTWLYFNLPATPWPELVRYVEDRDLWRFALPDSREINAYIQLKFLVGPSFDDWTRLDHEMGHSTSVFAGKALLAQQTWACKAIAGGATEFPPIDGDHAAAFYGIPSVYSAIWHSEVADVLKIAYPDASFVCVYRRNGERSYTYSLRSNAPGFNVREIAESFGGGGHERAAGFTTDAPIW